MYATLSLKRLAALLGGTFGLALIAMLLFTHYPKDAIGWARTLSTTLTLWSIALFLLFGFSGKWAPWRMLWFMIPPLNRFLPDLNGKWTGTTQSNFPVIEAMAESAEKGRPKLPRADLAKTPLLTGPIEMTITASLFAFRIKATVPNGESHSVTERVQKDKVRDCFTLSYVYNQQTTEPVLTDEAVHPGAARLDLDLEHWTLKGEYWTRRSWRSGFNTAGLIEVTRQSR